MYLEAYLRCQRRRMRSDLWLQLCSRAALTGPLRARPGLLRCCGWQLRGRQQGGWLYAGHWQDAHHLGFM